MANRRFTQFSYSLERAVVCLYSSVAIGASGAPTLNASASKGIASVTRVSAGKYTITFSDNYYGILGVDYFFSGIATSPAAPNMMVVSSTTNSVTVAFFNNSGTATDPDNGCTMGLEFQLSNTSVVN